MNVSVASGAARAAAIVFAVAFAPHAGAQAWPAKTVRIVMPFPPGGGTDQMGRLFAKRFTETFGQTFFAENRPGAGGLIGAEIVAKSPPDGYTILVTTASLSVNASLHRKLTFDPLKDLAPVSWLVSVPLLLAVHPSVPAKTPQELVALAKKRPGGMNAGTNGAGTTSHLAIEMLKQAAGFEVLHIHYKGGGPALVALLTGEVDFRFTSVLASIPHIRVGKMRPLAVTTAKPSAILPQLPTLGSIYPGVECDQWYAMFVPAGTPKDIVAKLHAETVKGLALPEVRKHLTTDGAEPVGSTPEELGVFFGREVAKYAKIIARANIRAD
ncbi:MAG: tripartite tricarboxylate transporter substrate binding protein [Betaproteobacteria bacterium]|nr:tripartite tricarboxylate transporter substrate binding protein [Betaproteobacteria bacterium]